MSRGNIYTADTLSRAPLNTRGTTALEELAELAIDACIANLPASKETLNEYEHAQNSDPQILSHRLAM
jgi:hypothetical protein